MLKIKTLLGVIESLANDSDPSVRGALAETANCPSYILKQLKADEVESVRILAEGNQSPLDGSLEEYEAFFDFCLQEVSYICDSMDYEVTEAEIHDIALKLFEHDGYLNNDLSWELVQDYLEQER